MKKIYEPASSRLTVQYMPNGGIRGENPPRFSWMPADENNSGYRLDISREENFPAEYTLRYENLPHNFFAPDTVLDTGTYFWRYSMLQNGEWAYSSTRQFTVDESSVHAPLKAYKDRYSNTFTGHPRLWLPGDALRQFQEQLAKNPAHCNFDAFYNNCVKPRLGQPMIQEPPPYPNNKRVISIWRQNYMDCQQALNHIRFLSIAGVLLQDTDILAQAVTALLEIAAWSPAGPTGRDYNDECAFRVAEALIWGYDWLYNYLDTAQREAVREVLLQRVGQVANHAIISSKIHYSLFDSHAVRSLSSVMLPACIALLGEADKAESWLNYTVDYLSVLYTPWGGSDGGWAEGGMYWTTGMAYLTSALNLLHNFTGINIFKRPFFQSTGSFPLYCFPHDSYRASFCDQSNLGEKPILKTGFNAREFAGITQNSEYQWYFEQIAKRESYNDTKFFNIGWWDFYFDEMLYLSNYPPIKAAPPQSGRQVKWFKDIGWVALHKDMHREEEHLFLLTKSSPYGSVSHSHGDQNGLLLFAYGEPLLIESGYYIGFNSSMHRQWRRQTKSCNAILINHKGQYAEMDKALQLAATGQIVSVEETPNAVHIVENATPAYQYHVPYCTNCQREIFFVQDAYFIIVDYIELEQPATVDFLLHSLYQPLQHENRLIIAGKKAELHCEFIYASAGVASMQSSNVFDGVDPAEVEGLEENWNFTLTTGQACKHTLVTCLYPKKAGAQGSVGVIKDDQGHDVYFYFNYEGQTFSLRIDGDKRY